MNAITLTYNGTPIRDRNDMLSLTDMWKAAGSPEHREPFNWSRFEGRGFIEAVALSHNLSETQVMMAKKGKGGGTFAHWQIGIAYAKYLSPEFHMWCNEVVRERMEGRRAPSVTSVAALSDEVRRTIGGIVKGIVHRELTESITSILPAMVAAALATQTMTIRRGKTAGQIWREHGLPKIRMGCWFGNRLSEMGCRIEGNGCGELGVVKARLFDPDKAERWLNNGGILVVKQKVAERQGQGRLKLVT